MRKIKGLYIVDFGDGIKIGMSLDCRSRIETYKSPWCKPILEVICLPVQYPKIVEASIKERFKDNIISQGSTEYITGIPFEKIKEKIWDRRLIRYKGQWLNVAQLRRSDWITLIPRKVPQNNP